MRHRHNNIVDNRTKNCSLVTGSSASFFTVVGFVPHEIEMPSTPKKEYISTTLLLLYTNLMQYVVVSDLLVALLSREFPSSDMVRNEAIIRKK